MTNTTIVLGWDALDAELVEEFDLGDSFGEFRSEIDTFDNPVLEEPHTRELWPSIITGVSPEDHGLWAATDEGGVQWDNPILNAASTVAQGIVPHGVRKRIGALLRDRGAGVTEVGPEYYAERGISTVFDGRLSRPVSVPNYHVDRDEELGISTYRTDIWNSMIETADDPDRTVYEPRVEKHELEEQLLSKTLSRLSVVRSALQYDYDIVFAWFGYLDTAGHLAPMIDEQGWQERHYRRAARFTNEIRSELCEDDHLICVSDHGLRDGRHTYTPVIASDAQRAVEGVESVLDVRRGIDAVAASSGHRTPSVRDEYRCEGTQQAMDESDVQEQLEDLGYL